MLIEFSAENFRSFAKKQTFSMVPAVGSSRIHSLDNNFYPEVLKVSAIYGANGSGKSNLVDSLGYFQHVLRRSAKLNSTDKISYDPHVLDASYSRSPSCFEVVFYFDKQFWRYGFSVSEKQVHKEWLFVRNEKPRSRETHLFQRSIDKPIYLHSSLGKYGRLLNETTNPNQLWLSKLDQNNAEIVQPAFHWITFHLRPIGNLGHGYRTVTAEKCLNDQSKKAVTEFLQSVAINLVDIQVDDDRRKFSPENLKTMIEENLSDTGVFGIFDDELVNFDISFIHRSKQNKFVSINITEESTGTQNLFALAGLLLDALEHGLTFIVDELNQTFHTKALEQIISLFYSDEVNTNGAQLIFTSHDLTIMDMMERDELWLVDKTAHGATELFSVADFGAIRQGGARRNEAFGRRYLAGRYGALPEIDPIGVISALKKNQKTHNKQVH
ncbi:MAG: ATP-binding protein [Robiginitomaculum sp.]|nr:ATP-binding protein [Robiginitomaculum sp.]